MPGAQVHSCHENAYIMLKEFAMPCLQCLAMPGQDPFEVKLVSDVRRSPGWHLAWLPWSGAGRHGNASSTIEEVEWCTRRQVWLWYCLPFVSWSRIIKTMISYEKVLEGSKITKRLLKFPMFLLETSRSVMEHLIPKQGHFQILQTRLRMIYHIFKRMHEVGCCMRGIRD